MAEVATLSRMALRSKPSGTTSSSCVLMKKVAAWSTANGIWSSPKSNRSARDNTFQIKKSGAKSQALSDILKEWMYTLVYSFDLPDPPASSWPQLLVAEDVLRQKSSR